MLLIPSIEVQNNKVMRSREGGHSNIMMEASEETPLKLAELYADIGADRIHLVDLGGALSGHPMSTKMLRQFVETVEAINPNTAIQVGGGIRRLEQIETYLDLGVKYVVVSTAAMKQPGFLRDACSNFGESIILALDAIDGKVAVDGWQTKTKNDIFSLAKKFENYNLNSILFTDIARAGTLSGLNVEMTAELARSVNVPIIASGGLHTLADIEQMMALESDGVAGVVMGRALYDGTLLLEEACDLVDGAL